MAAINHLACYAVASHGDEYSDDHPVGTIDYCFLILITPRHFFKIGGITVTCCLGKALKEAVILASDFNCPDWTCPDLTGPDLTSFDLTLTCLDLTSHGLTSPDLTLLS